MTTILTINLLNVDIEKNILVSSGNTDIDALSFSRYNKNKKQKGGISMDRNILTELVNGILSIMESQIASIILYGSVARGTNEVDSDVDVALLIHGTMDKETEDKLSDLIVDMNLKYDTVFSVIDIDYDNFKKWEKVTPFYQNVIREGVVLWKAA